MKKVENTELKSVKSRLIHFINSKDLSQAKFEKQVGLSNGYVNNIVNTISDKTFDYKIAPAFPELNKLWILYGDGEMITESDDHLRTPIRPPKNIKDLPHGEQMEILHNKIIGLEIQLKEEREENLKNTQRVIEFIDEYLKPVFDFMQESIEKKEKDNVK